MPAEMMPPALSGKPPMGAGPIALPTANPGAQASALSKVREAIKILEAQIPNLPLGSGPHKEILAFVTKISKHVGAGNEVPGVQQTALRDLGQQAQQSGMMQALMKSMGSSGTGGNAPGAPPPASSGGAPGAAPPPTA